MKIKVISLMTATSRRRSILAQFRRLDTSFEFFDAVTPRTSASHIKGYDEHEFIANCGRAATDTEIACYASHLELWRQCAREDEPFLVLEDDAHLEASFAVGALVTALKVRELGIVRVSPPALRASTVIDRAGPFEIHYCRRAPLLALGYALSPAAARELLVRGSVVEEPVDKFMQRFWRHGQPIHAITPPFVQLSSLADASNIGARHRPRPGVRLWMRRALRKTQNSMSRSLYNIIHVGKLRTARHLEAMAPTLAGVLRVR